MTYFNYHAIAKNLIKANHCISCSVFSKYKHIYPALVLYFDNHRPIPIREYMWQDYITLLDDKNIPINNPENLNY